MDITGVLERQNLPFKKNKAVMESEVNKRLGITDAEITINDDKEFVVKGTWSYIPGGQSVGTAITEYGKIYVGAIVVIPVSDGDLNILKSYIGRLENIGLANWEHIIKGYLQ